MASTRFDAFLPEVSLHVPGCPNPVAVAAIRNAAIEFCTDAPVWQETQDAFPAVAADFPLELEAPSGARATRVLALIVDGAPVDPVALDELDRRGFSWRSLTGTKVSGYYQPSEDTVSVYPLPSNALTFQLRVAYCPTRTASGMDATVAQRYMEQIAAGALWRLTETPGQVWSNPERALYFRDKFMRAKDAARIAASKAFSQADVRVQMRRFA